MGEGDGDGTMSLITMPENRFVTIEYLNSNDVIQIKMSDTSKVSI